MQGAATLLPHLGGTLDWSALSRIRARQLYANDLLLRPTDRTHLIAFGIQKRLWRGGKHRFADAIDVLTAAITGQHDTTVLHGRRRQARTNWVGQRGTL